jgi:ribose 5-phosphate isomerase
MTKSRGLLDAKDGQNGATALMRFNLASQLTVEVLSGAWRQVLGQLGEMGSTAQMCMTVRKTGQVLGGEIVDGVLV